MKIAYVCHHLRPNYEYDWFAAMPVEKIKFITTEEPPKGKTDRKIEHCQVHFEEKGLENRFFASTAKRVFYSDFEKHLADVDVVVVLEIFSSLSKQFIAYCKTVGIPVVALVYELIPEHPIYKIPRYRGNTKYCLRHADHFVAVSNAAADHLQKLGANMENVSVVYPGVDLQEFKPSESSAQKQHGMCFIGKLDPHKGITLTMNVYKRLLADIPDLTLDIAGNGGQRAEVEAFANQYSGVQYMGSVPHDELAAKVLTKNSLYILPARDTKRLGRRIGAEQFGFSIVEAMACGLAVATTTCGALPEIVTDENIICNQDDEDAMYIKLKALLNKPEKIAEVGQYNVKLTRERYDLHKQAAAFADTLAAVQSRKAD